MTLFWRVYMCPKRDSNPYGLSGQGILSPSRLPFRHRGGKVPPLWDKELLILTKNSLKSDNKMSIIHHASRASGS